MKMLHWRLFAWLALLACMTLQSVGSGEAHETELKTERRTVRIAIENFTLVDQGARPFEFRGLAGKAAVVSFSYTSCPDVCPLITAAMRQVQQGLSERESKNVHLVTVTTDPEVDSPSILAAYAKRYGAELANWSFVTGPETQLQKVWKNFGVGVKRKGRGLVDHTPLTAIVDQRGQMRYVYVGPSPDPRQVLTDVRALLAQR
jgi:protein SCO1/2